MSYRQQRTLSRRIIDTGQQPVGLPILIQPVISVDSVFGNFTLVFPIPVRVLGVPAYTSGDGGTCNGANLSTDTEVLLSFIGPASPGNVLDIPAWDPAIRGLEGEWVAGGRYLIGGGPGGGFPTLIPCTIVLRTEPYVARFVMETPYTPQSSAGFLIDNIPGLSINQVTANEIDVTFADEVYLGANASFAGGWNPAAYAPEGWPVMRYATVTE